jgi:hypothetical protein
MLHDKQGTLSVSPSISAHILIVCQFWNVKVVTRRPTSTAELEGEPGEPEHVEEEHRETPVSLKDKQIRMEQQVYRIWTYVHHLGYGPYTELSQCIVGFRGVQCSMHFGHAPASQQRPVS